MSAIVLPRRKFLAGLAAAFIAAPSVVRVASLMKITTLPLPDLSIPWVYEPYHEMMERVLAAYSSEIAANVTRSNALLRHLRIAA